MPTFLSVREAAQRTGKSPSSIRRVIYPIIHDDKHVDRKHIQPSVEDALKLRMKGENFAWRLNEEFLSRAVPVEAAPESGTAAPASKASSGHGDGELLAMLRRELDIKNHQITQQSELIGKQMELISGLSERLREGNILMSGLQQRLALTDGRDATPAETINVKTVTPTKSEKGNATPPKAAKADKGTVNPPKPAKPKRGLFSRLFR
jgi:hypothetical protein